MKVTSKQGDTLDELCMRYLGTTSNGIVEQAYELNNGLAALGVILPAGTVVVLPERQMQNRKSSYLQVF